MLFGVDGCHAGSRCFVHSCSVMHHFPYLTSTPPVVSTSAPSVGVTSDAMGRSENDDFFSPDQCGRRRSNTMPGDMSDIISAFGVDVPKIRHHSFPRHSGCIRCARRTALKVNALFCNLN